MLLYDTFTCQSCGKTYKGLFKLNKQQEIVCINCQQKEKYPKLKVNKKANQLEQDMVLDYLEKDISKLYPIVQANFETNFDLFLDSNGNLDTYKLYFQGNPLDFCTQVRDKAYLCLDYLDTNDVTHLTFAELFIGYYLDLRFKKLTDSEIETYNKLLISNELLEITIFLEG